MRAALFALALALSLPMAAEAATTINICTGAKEQPYANVGGMIADMAKGDPNINVRVITGTGGTWGNIQRTALGEASDAAYEAGEACHAMIGQPDGLAQLKRQNAAAASKMKPIGDLHREYLHVLCSKESGVDDIGDLESDPKGNGYSIALGDNGSGAWLIWQNFIAEDEDYAAVPVKNESGAVALASVAANETTCMLVPAALGNGQVRQADEMFGDSLVLAGANDSDFNDAVDGQGKPLYEWMKIPSGTYEKNLQGWFSSADTISWTAKVYVNTDRVSDNDALSSLIIAVARAKAAAQSQYGK